MVAKQLLQKSSLFRDLPADELEEIALACETVSLEAGEYIYKRDTEGDYFYVVLSGEVELIARREDNSTCMIGRIGEGGHFGESSLLTAHTRSLSVRAVSDVMLGRFSSVFFHETLLFLFFVLK